MQSYLDDVQTIIETNRKPFVILDSEFRVLTTNQRFLRTFDLTRDQVVGNSFYSIDHNDWDLGALHLLLEEQLPEDTALDDFEIEHTFARLGRKHLRMNAQFYRHGNIGQTLILLSIEDFTRKKELEDQLKESEERFRRMFETSRDGLLLISKDNGTIKHFNPAVMEMLGLDQDRLAGKAFLEIDIWADGGDFTTLRQKLDTDGFLTRQARLRNQKSQAQFDAEVFLINRASLIQCNVRDITDRKRNEEEREKLQGQLMQAQRLESIGRLAGGIAHDFNNMLSIVIGHSELMMDALGMEHPHRTAIEEILKAASRSADLTRQLLAFGRKQVLEIQRQDINHIIAGFETLIRRVIGEDVGLQLSLWSQPIMAEVDTTHIEQVLMNLAVNARDAMPDGGTLTIETAIAHLDADYAGSHPDVSPGEYAMIAICDTGFGMNQATLSQIFEPFFTTKGKDKGTGLGLATCYGVVKQHGGHIWVYSEPDHGTTFKIYLPLAQGPPSAAMPRKARGMVPGGGETVLVMEDDASLRQLICAMLARTGYRVIEAHSVEDALDMSIKSEKPIDLVLSDVIMPGMQGPEVVRRIRERHPMAAVLYMSGYTDDVIAHKGILDEDAQFIQKPFSLQSLTKKVQSSLLSVP